MTHAELVNLALSIHGSVLVAAIVAYYKYGERTELIEKGLRGSDSVLAQLRRILSSDLRDAIGGFLLGSSTIPTLTDDEQPAYVELPNNAVESEAFRETLRDFVESDAEAIADYRKLLDARNSWCFWAQFLSWALLSLIVLEIATVGLLGLLDKLAGVQLPDWAVTWSGLPVAMVVVAAVLPLPIMLRRHDKMMRMKIYYEVF